MFESNPGLCQSEQKEKVVEMVMYEIEKKVKGALEIDIEVSLTEATASQLRLASQDSAFRGC